MSQNGYMKGSKIHSLGFSKSLLTVETVETAETVKPYWLKIWKKSLAHSLTDLVTTWKQKMLAHLKIHLSRLKIFIQDFDEEFLGFEFYFFNIYSWSVHNARLDTNCILENKYGCLYNIQHWGYTYFTMKKKKKSLHILVKR